jgi:hypothetical protein
MCTLNNRVFYKVRELRDADSGDHAGCHLLVYSYLTAQLHVPVNNILNIIQCFIKTVLMLSSVQNHFHFKYADWTPTSKRKTVATEWQYRVLTGVLLKSKVVETEVESSSVVCLELLRGSILLITLPPGCWSLVVHKGSSNFIAKMLASDLPLCLPMSPGTT